MSDSSNNEALDKLYEQLSQELPKNDTTSRLRLNFNSGDKFQNLLEDYLKKKLRKGVPFLWNDLKALYQDEEKVSIIEKLVLSFEKSLSESQKFPEESEKEYPAVLMWTKFFLSQHFNAKNAWKQAFQYIDEAIKHTPTLPELYLQKGKIYKRSGDLDKASEQFEFARKLDLADRYLNTKSCKYLLRRGLIEQGTETAGKFTKEGEPPENCKFRNYRKNFRMFVFKDTTEKKKFQIFLIKD